MGLKIAGIMAVLMFAMGGLFYWYYKDSQDTINTLHKNTAKLEAAAATSESTIKNLQENYQNVQNELRTINEEFARIRVQNNVLSEKLRNHDLGLYAAEKPKWVARIVTRASNKAGRCIEILSGSKLTKQEKEAKSAKAFNSECPWLWPNSTASITP